MIHHVGVGDDLNCPETQQQRSYSSPGETLVLLIIHLTRVCVGGLGVVYYVKLLTCP